MIFINNHARKRFKGIKRVVMETKQTIPKILISLSMMMTPIITSSTTVHASPFDDALSGLGGPSTTYTGGGKNDTVKLAEYITGHKISLGAGEKAYVYLSPVKTSMDTSKAPPVSYHWNIWKNTKNAFTTTMPSTEATTSGNSYGVSSNKAEWVKVLRDPMQNKTYHFTGTQSAKIVIEKVSVSTNGSKKFKLKGTGSKSAAASKAKAVNSALDVLKSGDKISMQQYAIGPELLGIKQGEVSCDNKNGGHKTYKVTAWRDESVLYRRKKGKVFASWEKNGKKRQDKNKYEYKTVIERVKYTKNVTNQDVSFNGYNSTGNEYNKAKGACGGGGTSSQTGMLDQSYKDPVTKKYNAIKNRTTTTYSSAGNSATKVVVVENANGFTVKQTADDKTIKLGKSFTFLGQKIDLGFSIATFKNIFPKLTVDNDVDYKKVTTTTTRTTYTGNNKKVADTTVVSGNYSATEAQAYKTFSLKLKTGVSTSPKNTKVAKSGYGFWGRKPSYSHGNDYTVDGPYPYYWTNSGSGTNMGHTFKLTTENWATWTYFAGIPLVNNRLDVYVGNGSWQAPHASANVKVDIISGGKRITQLHNSQATIHDPVSRDPSKTFGKWDYNGTGVFMRGTGTSLYRFSGDGVLRAIYNSKTTPPGTPENPGTPDNPTPGTPVIPPSENPPGELTTDPNGGTINGDPTPKEVEGPPGTTYTPGTPVRYCYEFMGWEPSNVLDGNGTYTFKSGVRETIKAKWKKMGVCVPPVIVAGGTLKIDPNGGVYNGTSQITSIFGKPDTTYTPYTPTRNGYTFTGWKPADKIKDGKYTFKKNVTDTIVAQWKLDTTGGGNNPPACTTQPCPNGQFRLTIDPNGGSYKGHGKKFDITKSSDKYVDVLFPVRDGYVFNGWEKVYGSEWMTEYTDRSIRFIFGGNGYLKAKWIPENSTGILQINPNGGTYEGSSRTVTKTGKSSTVYDVKTPVRDGYSFTGWTITPNPPNGILSGNKYTFMTGTDTITAQWRKDERVCVVPNECPGPIMNVKRFVHLTINLFD